MKDSTDPKEKTSRRSFAKTVATALVAVPVVSSLSSCAQPPGPTPAPPGPQPTPKLLARGANPPVIIDGGSFEISVPATLIRRPDVTPPLPPDPPRGYTFRFKQKPNSPLVPIKGIHFIDEYGDELSPEYILGSNETLQVQLWITQVKADAEDIDNGTGEVEYKELSASPDIVIQGGKIEIRMDRDLSSRKLFKGKKKNKKRYLINDWDGGTSPFRIAKVVVNVSSKPDAIYTSSEADLENGLRIILFFP